MPCPAPSQAPYPTPTYTPTLHGQHPPWRVCTRACELLRRGRASSAATGSRYQIPGTRSDVSIGSHSGLGAGTSRGGRGSAPPIHRLGGVAPLARVHRGRRPRPSAASLSAELAGVARRTHLRAHTHARTTPGAWQCCTTESTSQVCREVLSAVRMTRRERVGRGRPPGSRCGRCRRSFSRSSSAWGLRPGHWLRAQDAPGQGHTNAREVKSGDWRREPFSLQHHQLPGGPRRLAAPYRAQCSQCKRGPGNRTAASAALAQCTTHLGQNSCPGGGRRWTPRSCARSGRDAASTRRLGPSPTAPPQTPHARVCLESGELHAGTSVACLGPPCPSHPYYRHTQRPRLHCLPVREQSLHQHRFSSASLGSGRTCAPTPDSGELP